MPVNPRSGLAGAAIDSMHATNNRVRLWRKGGDMAAERGSADSRVVLIQINYPSLAEAERAGRAMLEARLAACVNILPGVVSHYWWQGQIERADEVMMIVKTRASLVEAVRAAMRGAHPYVTPSFLVLPVEGGDSDYLAWLRAETEGAAVSS
jgi:periplasmic divalent cation tolerance protein